MHHSYRGCAGSPRPDHRPTRRRPVSCPLRAFLRPRATWQSGVIRAAVIRAAVIRAAVFGEVVAEASRPHAHRRGGWHGPGTCVGKVELIQS